ncbi:TRAP transporter permease DctQ [Anaeromicrobium sediminis]|uniref:TRAP transporter permease DctQ n=2 Tax=Anaeromicrobium sediminis TaxID=1478221 RepID=A0A267MIK1_9FIRM|nr:TRAP transporter permease DctQ [Anaeromicrobium sediminis]
MLSKIEEAILSYSIIIMAIILIGNVFSRSVLNRSWTFAEELGQSLVIIVTFTGISYGAKKARHINMSALFDVIPVRGKKIFMYVISSVTSISMFYLAYLASIYVMKVKTLGRVTPALRIPIYLVYLIVPIGFFLGGIQYARNFWINVKEKEVYLSTEKGIRGTDDNEEQYINV